MSALITLLVAPLGTALVLAVAWWALRRGDGVPGGGRGRVAAIAGAAAVGWPLVWSTPLAGGALRGWIEGRSGPRAVEEVVAAPVMVVLGGATAGPRPPRRVYPDLTGSADRLWHAARLYRAGKAPRLLLAGGTVDTGDGSEAAAMRLFLRDMGVPDSVMVLEAGSTSTAENARLAAAVLRDRGVDTVLLVTSALHMPRARALFRRAGLVVHPAPTDVEIIDGPLTVRSFLPSATALEGSGRAFKELLGWALAARR
jgi:uncharacterized SAM-binding protein YcdF (DUF218 family)